MRVLVVLIVLFSCLTVKAQIKLDIDIYTGDDNLERQDFQKNPEIRIILKGKADVVKANINRGATWGNSSLHRITMELPADVQFRELAEIHLRRDRKDGRKYVWDYLKKDNWTLKGIAVTATIMQGDQKVKITLLNKTEQRQLYRFTYDGDDVNPAEGVVYKGVFQPDLPGGSASGVKDSEPVLPPGNATLTAIIGTGADNLEGGNDNNINLEIRFKNSGRIIRLNNVNQRQKWNNNTERTIARELDNTRDIDINDIGWVTVTHTGGGGLSADNWNMSKFKLTIKKDSKSRLLVNMSGLHRFTGDNRMKEFEAAGENQQHLLKNATITAVFGTGDDNLEGGTGNNVNLIIRFKNSSKVITVTNLNKGSKWNNNSERTITDRELPNTFDINLDDIKEVEVRHTGGGGIGADNWNMDKFKLTIMQNGRKKELVDVVKRPVHRFTGDSRSKIFVVENVISF